MGGAIPHKHPASSGVLEEVEVMEVILEGVAASWEIIEQSGSGERRAEF